MPVSIIDEPTVEQLVCPVCNHPWGWHCEEVPAADGYSEGNRPGCTYPGCSCILCDPPGG
jgi:hypothetical protein